MTQATQTSNANGHAAAQARARELVSEIGRVAPSVVHKRIKEETTPVAARVLEQLHAPQALETLGLFAADARSKLLEEVSSHKRTQWEINQKHPKETVGHLMELPVGVFAPETTVAEATERLREEVKRAFITYGYITDPQGKLIGLIVMREMLLARPEQTLEEIMLSEPFFLTPEMRMEDAMRAAVGRHFPVYPVCDKERHLVGLVRGDDLFEQNVFQLVVQAGSMVGVENEERLATSWPRALRLRNPWLLINLVTAFVAGGVVRLFEGTIEQIVALAAFLPVLAGQSGNTGCQALAVTLRGMALGEMSEHRPVTIVAKEALLGLLNGAVVGVLAGAAMLFFWGKGGDANPMTLAVIVFAAMTGSCVASGVSGAVVPLALKRLGADPATASSIFLTTATDVVSMGLLLGLATVVLL